jgi:hypothetical protein
MLWSRILMLGPGQALKMRARVGLGLGLGSEFAGLGAYVCSKIALGVWPASLAQNTGPCGLRLLVYVVKA